MSGATSLEAIFEDGQCVYALNWESDRPGGAGVERVFSLNSLYTAALDDGELLGPYESLREAIRQNEQLHIIGPCVTGIESTELNADEIQALLTLSDELIQQGCSLMVNGEKRTLQAQ